MAQIVWRKSELIFSKAQSNFNPVMKFSAARIAICVFVLLLVCELARIFYCALNSERLAFQLVKQNCIEQGLDVHNLTGPVDGRVGNSPKSYSWDYKDNKHHYEFLVTFDFLYDSKIARWDYDRKD